MRPRRRGSSATSSAGSASVANLPPARLRRALSRFVEARDAALARLVPDDADLLPLDPGHDACDAYEAFGGALPAALRLRSFWGGRRAPRAPVRGAEARRPPEGPARRPPCMAWRDRHGRAREAGEEQQVGSSCDVVARDEHLRRQRLTQFRLHATTDPRYGSPSFASQRRPS
ncbi:hypothetical protein WMF28_25680 [Sorangium sp. So ce590]|uniref:hypothetical protein n=1 Tax=Sorangium sp. So ce590 TaxID=3133317 RepID=UPI003F62ED0F